MNKPNRNDSARRATTFTLQAEWHGLLADRRRNGSGDRPFKRHSLTDLISKLAHNIDARLLAELHTRQLRAAPEQRPQRIVEYVTTLCDTAWAQRVANGPTRCLEFAYDETLNRLGWGSSSTASNDSVSRSDCRRRFRALDRAIKRAVRRQQCRDAAQKECIAAGLLQRFVARQFRWALHEAVRQGNRARTRYVWQVGKGAITVWMPARLRGSRRRAWLESNVDSPNPLRPGESARVQLIIDARLGLLHEQSLEGSRQDLVAPSSCNDPLKIDHSKGNLPHGPREIRCCREGGERERAATGDSRSWVGTDL
jgi:hypothetical protein